jgi:hypothetical protein
MSSPPAPYFDVNFVDQNDQQTHQLDFTDNPFVAPEEQYRFDLKQWLAFIHEVRAKLSYLQVYALEEGPQIPQVSFYEYSRCYFVRYQCASIYQYNIRAAILMV